MFNSFSWKLREVSGLLSSPTQSHPSALCSPYLGIVAEGGPHTKKRGRNGDGEMVFQGCTTMRQLTRIRYCILRLVRDDKYKRCFGFGRHPRTMEREA